MKSYDRFKKLKTELLDLDSGIVAIVQKDYFVVVSEGSIWRISKSSPWVMEMDVNMPAFKKYFEPDGMIV